MELMKFFVVLFDDCILSDIISKEKGMYNGGQSQHDVPNQHRNLTKGAEDARWPPQKRMKNWKLYKEAKDENENSPQSNTVKDPSQQAGHNNIQNICMFSSFAERSVCPSLGCMGNQVSERCQIDAALIADGVICPACVECWTEDRHGFRLKDDGCPALFHECHVTDPFPGCDFPKFINYKGRWCPWCYEQVC